MAPAPVVGAGLGSPGAVQGEVPPARGGEKTIMGITDENLAALRRLADTPAAYDSGEHRAAQSQLASAVPELLDEIHRLRTAGHRADDIVEPEGATPQTVGAITRLEAAELKRRADTVEELDRHKRAIDAITLEFARAMAVA